MNANSQQYSQLQIWLLAARPKTLWAGITPVLMGGAIAFEVSKFHVLAFCAALAGSVLIQIGTNFANDLFDYLKETDTEDRVGPFRVTQAGLVSPKKMMVQRRGRHFYGCFSERVKVFEKNENDTFRNYVFDDG